MAVRATASDRELLPPIPGSADACLTDAMAPQRIPPAFASGATMLTTSDNTASETTTSAGPTTSVSWDTEGAVVRPPQPADFTPDDVLAAHRGGKLSVSLRAPLPTGATCPCSTPRGWRASPA